MLHLLQELNIKDCDDLETLPEWLGDLTSSRRIRILGCPKLSWILESIQLLTELEELQIHNCPALTEKCQEEERHKIAHIPYVVFM